jgi:hypothetical protein
MSLYPDPWWPVGPPICHVCDDCGLSWQAELGEAKEVDGRMQVAWGPVDACVCGAGPSLFRKWKPLAYSFKSGEGWAKTGGPHRGPWVPVLASELASSESASFKSAASKSASASSNSASPSSPSSESASSESASSESASSESTVAQYGGGGWWVIG